VESKKCPTCGGKLKTHTKWLSDVHLEMAKNYKKALAHLAKIRRLQSAPK